MNMMRYEPWAMLNDISRELDRVFQTRQREQANPLNSWIPPVDIRETEESYLLSMDIPGVDPQAVEVSVEQGVLEVSGERKTGSAETDQPGYQRQERLQGGFKRRFKLPESADGSEITARSEHGVLEILIKKRAEQRPRRITIAH